MTDGFQRGHAGVYVGTNSSGDVSGNKITVIEKSPNSAGIPDQAFGYGVHVDKKSYAKVTGNTIELKITAGTGDSGSTGIYADKSSAVDSSGNTFKSNGKGMLGISANEGSVITSVGDTFVADGPWSKAFQIYSNSVAVIRSADITANGGTGEVKNGDSPLAMKDTSRGIDVANNSKVDVSGSVIKMKGDSSNAISVMADSYGKIEKTTIETNGASSHGIEVVGTPWYWGAPSNTASADIKDVKIHTTGSRSNGLRVENLADVRAENVEITTLGKSAHAVYSNGGGVGASADIKGGKIATSDASAGYGFNKASITYDNTEFNIGGNVYAFMVYTNSTINLNNITKFSNNSGALLYTGDSGALNMSGTTIGGSIIHGANYGTIGALDVVMSGSKWSGYADVADKDAVNAKINLTLDETSLWNVTNDSYTNGALNNNGLINFGEKAEDGFKTVEVASYKGG
ncbi:MAG: hypothetical protein RR015_03430, partial [Bacteroidales bacterium]